MEKKIKKQEKKTYEKNYNTFSTHIKVLVNKYSHKLFMY